MPIEISTNNGRIKIATGEYANATKTAAFNAPLSSSFIELKLDDALVPQFIRARLHTYEFALTVVPSPNSYSVGAVNGVTPSSLEELYNLLDAAI